jgi:hypothetical protein
VDTSIEWIRANGVRLDDVGDQFKNKLVELAGVSPLFGSKTKKIPLDESLI